ncbi:7 transmembrane receptor [Ancylostoma caninum]|uniref:7 transmembrane receptor n=1 Tax=Ancylostoma caninum TaxID=29170 RepID=A0A368H5P8_ANCCA|nr:7 transmembrane receptor [Ancylostoma caninum]
MFARICQSKIRYTIIFVVPFQSNILIPTVIIYSTIFVIGIVGNICTCLVIIRNKSMHTHTNFYVFSLAVSDLLVLFLGLPMELHTLVDFAYPYVFGEWFCKGRAYLIEFTSYASILVICSFTVERWLAICHPLRSRSSSKVCRAYITIIVMWAISAVAALPVGYIVKINRLPLPPWAMNQPWTGKVSDDYETVKNTEFCAMDLGEQQLQKHLICFAFLVFFLVPAFLITIMYSQIATRIASTDTLLWVNKKEARTKSTQNMIKMLVSVVVSFFLCWLPFHMQRLLSLFISYHEGNVSPAVGTLSTLVFYISGCCYYSNSATNPILYNVFSEKFRKAFMRTILGQGIAKKLRPQWYLTRSSVMRSNMDNSLFPQRITGNHAKFLVVPDDRHAKTCAHHSLSNSFVKTSCSSRKLDGYL